MLFNSILTMQKQRADRTWREAVVLHSVLTGSPGNTEWGTDGVLCRVCLIN